MKSTGRKFIQETRYGTYVWEMPDGRWVGDDEGNYATIFSMQGDAKRIEELRALVRSCGVEVGRPLFLPGRRPVSDEEFEEQMQRFQWGLTPDPYDIPAVAEEQRYSQNND